MRVLSEESLVAGVEDFVLLDALKEQLPSPDVRPSLSQGGTVDARDCWDESCELGGG